MKVVINRCFGGFGLSESAYEKLIEWGVPVRKYIEQKRDPVMGLYQPEPLNDGELIFDRSLSPESDFCDALHIRAMGRYWDGWISQSRTHSLIVRVVEELGEKANGPHAELSVIEIPDGIDYEIDEYKGIEHIAEVHRTWG